MSFADKIREKLAELEHKQWVHWWNYQNKKLRNITNMSMDEWYKQQDIYKQWKRLAQTPYSQLTEKEKESDRKWADKVLVIFNKVVAGHKQKLLEADEKGEAFIGFDKVCSDCPFRKALKELLKELEKDE